jgi:hypothetical protein
MATNITWDTATVVSSLPYTDNNDLFGVDSLWYKYTPTSAQTGVSYFAWSDHSITPCGPEVSVYRVANPSDNPLTQATFRFASSSYPNQPGLIPFTPGSTYYFSVSNWQAKDGNPEPVRFTLVAAPTEPIIAGSIFICDDSRSFPVGVFLDPIDGHIRSILYPFPAGERAACLNDGTSLWQDESNYPTSLALYSSAWELITNVTGVLHATNGTKTGMAPFIVSTATQFFTGHWNTVTREFLVSCISATGTIIRQWHINIPSVMRLMAVSPDGTILYYIPYGTSEIKRWDLTNDVALSSLVADTAGVNAQDDIVILPDGRIILAVHVVATNTYQVRHYDSGTGALLATWDYGAEFVNRFGRIVGDDTAIWVWVWPLYLDDMETSYTCARYEKVRIADGVKLVTFSSALTTDGVLPPWNDSPNPPARIAPSESCPMYIVTANVTPIIGDGGIYFIHPDKTTKHDNYYRGIEKKIPNPTVRLGFIGD